MNPVSAPVFLDGAEDSFLSHKGSRGPVVMSSASDVTHGGRPSEGGRHSEAGDHS